MASSEKSRCAPRISAHVDGFDLHAGLRVVADDPRGREQLEKVLRYCARPAPSEERPRSVGDKVVLRLKTAWRDGTTHVVYEAIDFVAKLVALVPRPHKNLVLYHGVLSAHAAWRARVVVHGRDAAAESSDEEPPASRSERPRHERGCWAALMKRAFGLDVLSCTQCGGRMRLIAVLLDRAAIRKVLAHLDLPIESERASTRGPPDDDCFAFDTA
jgi:Putative transposase